MAAYLDKDQLGLYELIWKRTVASQMESAVLDQVTVDIASGDKTVQLRATGSVVKFNGFLTLYDEGRDENERGRGEATPSCPTSPRTRRWTAARSCPEQHFTEPPPRYSEASLVKKLEELGIGRPSTYASIIEVLQRRNYVKIDRKRFIPEDRGRIVTAFLQTYFPRYVEYNFTAHLEEELDDISDGKIDWRQVLREFWKAFSAAVGETKDLRVKEVLDKLDEELGPHFFPANDNGGKSPRDCPSCANGRLGLKLGKFGAFIGCSNYPECKLHPQAGHRRSGEGCRVGRQPRRAEDPGHRSGDRQAGHPAQRALRSLRPARRARGQGEAQAAVAAQGHDAGRAHLEKALALLSLPRELGPHPEDRRAGAGRRRPLRALRQARQPSTSRSRPTRACSRSA